MPFHSFYAKGNKNVPVGIVESSSKTQGLCIQMSLEYIFAFGLVSYIGKEQTEWEDKKYQRSSISQLTTSKGLKHDQLASQLNDFGQFFDKICP